MNFFIDMDGVLVDFDQGFKNIYGESPCEFKQKILDLYKKSSVPELVVYQMFDELFWKMIDIVPSFWENLPPFEYAIEDLNQFIRENPNENITILSTVPINQPTYDNSIQGKQEWLYEYILNYNKTIDSYFPPTRYYGEDSKSIYCNSKDDILIDDSKFQIEGWKKKGGIGVLFDSNMYNDYFTIKNKGGLYEILESCVKKN